VPKKTVTICARAARVSPRGAAAPAAPAAPARQASAAERACTPSRSRGGRRAAPRRLCPKQALPSSARRARRAGRGTARGARGRRAPGTRSTWSRPRSPACSARSSARKMRSTRPARARARARLWRAPRRAPGLRRRAGTTGTCQGGAGRRGPCGAADGASAHARIRRSPAAELVGGGGEAGARARGGPHWAGWR